MILADKILRAVNAQLAEVDRLTRAAETELPAAKARLADLTALQARVTVADERLYARMLDLLILVDS